MAASQNPLQGSLFKGEEKSSAAKAYADNSPKFSNDHLSNKQLKDDAYLRPRQKQTRENPKETKKENRLLGNS